MGESTSSILCYTVDTRAKPATLTLVHTVHTPWPRKPQPESSTKSLFPNVPPSVKAAASVAPSPSVARKNIKVKAKVNPQHHKKQ